MDTEIENAAYKFAESQNDGSNFTAYYKGFIAGTKYKKSSNGVSLSMNIIPPMTDTHGKYNGKMWKGRFQTLKGEKWFLMWCHDENKLSNQIYISSREILVL